ncbi:cactin-like [Actinia tenebrosa]|uniref:Cactin-like n=1 Tax=Actinia tenebrosa TaxID=6105 RepID=A0A6P8IGL9_ACTTE|nr:cactin-like [Actinia tenebrosa]
MAGGDKKKKKRSERSRSRSPRRRDRSRSPRRRKRRDSSASTSSSLSEDERRREKGYQKNSGKIPKDKKKEKEYYKAHETPEEKRARRLAKKEAKERKRRKEMGWNDEYEGYTNTDNPFGDAHLLETFVWHKKREKQGETHLTEEEKRFTDKKRQMDTRKQLERVRERRTEREREMMLREEEKERMQREKESEYYSEWEKQEDKFHLNQAKLRSKIRIQDRRAKPIDLLAQYISAEEEDLDIKMHEPYTILVVGLLFNNYSPKAR